MNKEYTYIDGKMIIADENGEKSQRDYYDNLEKVLVQENVIETMEKKLQELEKENGVSRERLFVPTFFPLYAFLIFGAPHIINNFTAFNIFESMKNTNFGQINLAMMASILSSIVFLPTGAFIDSYFYRSFKDSINRRNGTNNEIDFLRKHLEEQREILENLQQEKSRDNENTEFRTVKIDDSQQLKELKRWLNVYFDLGYNGKKYYRYYNKGILERKLNKIYSNDEINKAKEYLEKNKNLLTFKKKKKSVA